MAIYRARLLISVPGNQEAQEYEESMMSIEVGVPAKRLRATKNETPPGGAYADERLLLVTSTDKAFLPDCYAPTRAEMESAPGSRWVQVPGWDTASPTPPPGEPPDREWTLHFDDSMVDQIEAFIDELRAQGCVVQRVPAGG